MPTVWSVQNTLSAQDVTDIAADPRAKPATVTTLQNLLATKGSPLIGIFIFGSGSSPDFILERSSFPLETVPLAPVVTPAAAGSVAWGYKIVPLDASLAVVGATGPEGLTALGVATLTNNRNNLATWVAVTGSVSYDVYRTTSGGNPATLGKIGNVTTLSFTDTGATGDGTTAPVALPSDAVGANIDGQMATTYTNSFGDHNFFVKSHFWNYRSDLLYVPRGNQAGDYAFYVDNGTPPANWWQGL